MLFGPAGNLHSWSRSFELVSGQVALQLTTFVLAVLTGGGASAQIFSGPVTRSTGGAGRASMEASEASLVNPATLTQSRGLSLAFHKGVQTFDHLVTDETAFIWVDHSDGVFMPAGIAFVGRDGPNTKLHDFQISAAKSILPPLSVGITLHHGYLENLVTGEQAVTDNLHMGLLYTPYLNLGFALVIYDFLPGRNAGPMTEYFPHGAGAFGLQYNYSELIRGRLDLVQKHVVDFTEPTDLMLGIETHVLENLAVRFGYQWLNSRQQRYFTMGMGWTGPRLSFDFALVLDSEGGDPQSQLIDLRMPL